MNSLLLSLSGGYIFLIVLAAILVVYITFVLIFVPIKLWITALFSNSHISMKKLMGMKMRKVNVREVVLTYITSQKAGLSIDISELEMHSLAGGDIDKVIKGLIAGQSAKLDIDFELAKAIDLAGVDVVEAVETCITPKVIEVKDISAVSQDGIEVIVNVKVTLKTNIKDLVGCAKDDTIKARVEREVVDAIGSSETYNELLEKPSSITEDIDLEIVGQETSYEVISIDISEINVGKNVGAKLETEEAEKNKVLTQVQAERIKQIAIAEEQKMKAKTQEMKASVLAAEAEIPKAIAEAIKSGKFGVLDYYKLQNLQADTAMRNSIAGKDNKKENIDENDDD